MFTSVIDTVEGTLLIQTALICMVVSILLGLVMAFAYMIQGRYTKQFVITLVILPVLVQTVIMLVNGNLGTSVAVMGAFSLVRFRSLPGSARDISAIFFAMVVGLATGMGFVSYAVIITVLVCIVMVLLSKSKLGDNKEEAKDLRITIPENLDYSEIFDDLFEKYAAIHSLNRVKTSNMGSMYELSYSVVIKADSSEKEFIDELRCRNGNLPIICSRPEVGREEIL